ncbi:MAG: bifunctional 5,10-methylenetetrahydrofolate dehydrogenase/5,10-methenyltetrahydrofolate cyclohydrolase [Candidatus Pacebacteria bacterium]|nr:bifunctional 5,10-methylenetetrahydrofolate dehydrogenase/5,10-methenyltetrahydrofolate cyclohydrolase [Candidatus Paceibacterota bacterium]
MIIDGKAVAKRIYDEVAKEVAGLSKVPVMAAITCAPNFETQKYLELKKRKAEEVGITLRVVELPKTATTEEVTEHIQTVLLDVDGVVVQLPFPAHIDRETVLRAVPVTKDPDGFSYGTISDTCLPPVPAAIMEIAKAYNISFKDKVVLVLGQGRLVGLPTARFLETQGANVTVLTKDDKNPEELLQNADIIVTGIGVPHFVTKEMVRNGVVIFDAGTSEDGGLMVGDVHPDVAQKASFFTPVPGGIGPVTVAVLLKNLVSLIE